MNVSMTSLTLPVIAFLLFPFQSIANENNGEVLKQTATATLQAEPMNSSYMLQLFAGLIIVILSIIMLAWITKKVNRFSSYTGDSLKIIGGLSMGSREKVVLLQVGDKQLLIGVAPGRINTLHELDIPVEAIQGQSEAGASTGISSRFRQTMDEASNRKSGKPVDEKRRG